MTSTVNNRTKPNKDPRRVEAGKNLLNTTRGREEKKKKGSLNQPEPSSSFSLTHILSEASVVLSLAIKEELMALVNKQETTAKHTNTDSSK